MPRRDTSVSLRQMRDYAGNLPARRALDVGPLESLRGVGQSPSRDLVSAKLWNVPSRLQKKMDFPVVVSVTVRT